MSALGQKRTSHDVRVMSALPPDAMSLPFPTDTFDAATMALVITFVPDPIKGVVEMARVVRPGGVVATYIWDMLGGGYPWEPIHVEMSAMGLTVLSPPSLEASRIEVPHRLRCS
jgi:ubiquinone/menaquinone biosynthesis C-methylase UbiE